MASDGTVPQFGDVTAERCDFSHRVSADACCVVQGHAIKPPVVQQRQRAHHANRGLRATQFSLSLSTALLHLQCADCQVNLCCPCRLGCWWRTRGAGTVGSKPLSAAGSRAGAMRSAAARKLDGRQSRAARGMQCRWSVAIRLFAETQFMS